MEKLLLVFSISLSGLFLLISNAVLFLWKVKNTNFSYKLITIFLVLDAINESICNVTGFTNPGTNLILSHAHFHFHFVFFSLLYYQILSNKFKKVIIYISIIFYILIAYVYVLNTKMLFNISPQETGIISFILIAYALIFLYQSIENQDKKYYNISLGLILYLTSSSIIFFAGTLNQDIVLIEDPYVDIWVFNSIFFIIYQVLIYKEWKRLTA